MEKLESLAGKLAGVIAAATMIFAIPNYASGKITQIERRRDGTITRIYDDSDPEGYLKPVYFCSKCEEYHPDGKRIKPELQFQAKSGRIVDYLPQTRKPNNNTNNNSYKIDIPDLSGLPTDEDFSPWRIIFGNNKRAPAPPAPKTN